MPTAISFQRDDLWLRGRMHTAQGDGPFATIVLLHGSPGNEIDVLGLGQKLAERNLNVLTFNYSGTHQSDGLFSFANTQLDIHAAYKFLKQPENVERFRIDTTRLYLGGWSYGGGMALTYAANHAEIDAVFSIAGTDHGEFMREYASDSGYRAMVNELFEGFKQPDSLLRLAPGEAPAEYLERGLDIAPYDLRMSAPSLASKHVLLVGGWDDLNVKIDNHLLPLYRALKAENAQKVMIRAFQDDHAFGNVRDQLPELIVEWIKAVDRRQNQDDPLA